MQVELADCVQQLQACYSGNNCMIHGVSIDSRTTQPGDLFIAIAGDTFDGHDFIDQAKARGAAAVMVHREALAAGHVLVPDTQAALLNLAAWWRSQFTLPVVAITGSCGKTSTRALLESILSGYGVTLASQKSYNNHIGVPLTVFQLRPEHQYAVFEIGANHAGEIDTLVKVVRPTVSILTCAAAAHLQGFGSLEGVAAAKAEIFSTLSAGHTAVINHDDPFASYWRKMVPSAARIRSFSIYESAADVALSAQAVNASGGTDFTATTSEQQLAVSLPLVGAHQVANALAAIAAAGALAVPAAAIQAGLSQVTAPERRMSILRGRSCAKVIDDSYNANPSSVQAAIAVLSANSGIRVLVLGDMNELGASSAYWHQQVGAAAKAAGVDYLFCYGPLSIEAARAFGSQGHHFTDHQQLIAALEPILASTVSVLVKGSNAMQMDRVVAGLIQE